MFTTGSKLLIGSAVAATFAAVMYIVTQNESLGIVGLISAAIVLGFVAGVNVWARDSNVSAMDTHAVATSEAMAPRPGNSVWPMVFGVGAATVLLGLVTQQSIFVIGLVILFGAGAQWAIQAWAEAAPGDATTRADVRDRLANPLEYPLLGAVGVGAIAFALSRVMLWLSKTNTVIAFAVVATVVALIAFFFAMRPTIKRGAIGGVVAVGAIAILATGVAAGVDGQRDIHEHETIGADARAVCDSAKKTPVDKDVSQTLSIKSNTAAQVILTESGELTFDVPGPVESGTDVLSLPRSNPNNIIFRNESGEKRRLTLDLGPADDAAEEADDHADDDDHGDEHGELSDRNLLCTTLIEDGAAQLLTVIIGTPSIDPVIADDPDAYRFYVPGTDAELGVYVP